MANQTSADADCPIGRNKMPAHVQEMLKGTQKTLPAKVLACVYLNSLQKDSAGVDGIKPIEHHILLTLLTSLKYKGDGFRSQRDLADDTGRVQREVGKAIALAVELGLVEVTKKGRYGGDASEYQWRWPARPITPGTLAEARQRVAQHAEARKRRRQPKQGATASAGTRAPAAPVWQRAMQEEAIVPVHADPGGRPGGATAHAGSSAGRVSGFMTLEDMDAIDDAEWERMGREWEAERDRLEAEARALADQQVEGG